MDLFGFVDLAADLGLDAVELTSYYFPENVSSDYLNRLKTHAFRQGLDVSGTAVMNDSAFRRAPGRQGGGARRAWIGRAAELDAPTIRVLSGNWLQGTPDEELERRVIQRIESLLPDAASKGVMLALENHGGGVTVTAEQLLRLVRAIKGPNFGVNLDTGNFHGPDPYAEIAQAAPYAVNVQVKTEIRRRGRSKEPADCRRSSASFERRNTPVTLCWSTTPPRTRRPRFPRFIKTLRSLIARRNTAPPGARHTTFSRPEKLTQRERNFPLTTRENGRMASRGPARTGEAFISASRRNICWSTRKRFGRCGTRTSTSKR